MEQEEREACAGSGQPTTTSSKELTARGRKRVNGSFVKKDSEDYEGLVQVGQMFGHWRVLSEEVRVISRYRYVLCSDGYTTGWVSYDTIRSGKSTHGNKFPRYGHANYRNIRVRWEQMMERCYNPANPAYKDYGARGIKVSEEFHTAREYVDYVNSLPREEGCDSIDRIDNDKGYERGNLRWTTHQEQMRNRRACRYVQFAGKKMCLREFESDHCRVGYAYARKMLDAGHTPECVAAMEPGHKSGGIGLRYCRCGSEPRVLRKGD